MKERHRTLFNKVRTLDRRKFSGDPEFISPNYTRTASQLLNLPKEEIVLPIGVAKTIGDIGEKYTAVWLYMLKRTGASDELRTFLGGTIGEIISSSNNYSRLETEIIDNRGDKFQEVVDRYENDRKLPDFRLNVDNGNTVVVEVKSRALSFYRKWLVNEGKGVFDMYMPREDGLSVQWASDQKEIDKGLLVFHMPGKLVQEKAPDAFELAAEHNFMIITPEEFKGYLSDVGKRLSEVGISTESSIGGNNLVDSYLEFVNYPRRFAEEKKNSESLSELVGFIKRS